MGPHHIYGEGGESVQNWKNEAIRELTLMEQRRLAAEGLRLRIRWLDNDAVSLAGGGGNSVPVKGGGNRQEQRLCAFLDKKAELEEEERGLREMVEHTERCLAGLPERERLVLECFYCRGLERGSAVCKLERELYCSRSEVYRIRDRALVKMALMLGIM